MKLIDKIALIHLQNGRVLSSLSEGKDTWYLPGGKREGDETDLQTLLREIREELNVALNPADVRYYGTFEAQAHGKAEGVLVRMTCYTAPLPTPPVPSAEIAQLRWLTTADMGIISAVDKLIFADLHEKGLLD
ncbi:MAG: NUDIX domain-containing protein [Clostridia bacterium]|nr:NUDIX domain-containing protein [Clostridia bacterium]